MGCETEMLMPGACSSHRASSSLPDSTALSCMPAPRSAGRAPPSLLSDVHPAAAGALCCAAGPAGGSAGSRGEGATPGKVAGTEGCEGGGRAAAQSGGGTAAAAEGGHGRRGAGARGGRRGAGRDPPRQVVQKGLEMQSCCHAPAMFCRGWQQAAWHCGRSFCSPVLRLARQLRDTVCPAVRDVLTDTHEALLLHTATHTCF